MLIRLLIWSIVAFLIYTVMVALGRVLRGPSSSPADKSAAGEEMVQDPHCKTFIPRPDAVRATFDDTTYYFCSKDCLQSFRNTQKS